jgi:hypothetical protein
MSYRAHLRETLAVDPQAATRLGYEASYWWRLKTGDRPLSDECIRRARLAYPELDGLCTKALLEPRVRKPKAQVA